MSFRKVIFDVCATKQFTFIYFLSTTALWSVSNETEIQMNRKNSAYAHWHVWDFALCWASLGFDRAIVKRRKWKRQHDNFDWKPVHRWGSPSVLRSYAELCVKEMGRLEEFTRPVRSLKHDLCVFELGFKNIFSMLMALHTEHNTFLFVPVLALWKVGKV